MKGETCVDIAIGKGDDYEPAVFNFRPLVASASEYIFKVAQGAMISRSQPGTGSLTESFFTVQEYEEYAADNHETPTSATFADTERVRDKLNPYFCYG